MSLLYPGGQGRRTGRASQLLVHWRAADATLVAQTGQPVTFHYLLGSSTVIGKNGVEVSSGVGMPRFQMEFDTTTRLRTTQSLDEYLSVPYNLYVGAVTVYVKLRHLYALGSGGSAQPGNVIAKIGTDTGDGGYLRLARSSDGIYRVTRANASATSTAASAQEAGTWVRPYELTATLMATGAARLQIRDASGVTRADATGSAFGALITTTQQWDGTIASLGGGSGLGDDGGSYDFEEWKVCLGEKSIAEMAALG